MIDVEHCRARGDEVLIRCAPREPCEEVVARLEAAQRSEREGFADIAGQLRATAGRYAEVHNYGQTGEDTSS